MSNALKKLPVLKSDAEAEQFVEASDLSTYDLSAAVPTPFRFERKDATMTMRIAPSLLNALKAEASDRGLKYQQLVTKVLEDHILSNRA